MQRQTTLTKFQRKLYNNCRQYVKHNCDIDKIIPENIQPTKRDLTKKFYVFNAMNCANFTVSSYYIYKVKQLPPKELQYPGWEKQQIIYYNYVKLNMTQFWVVHVRKPVPECLQYDGWQQDKFVYKVLVTEHRQHSDDECDVYDYIFLYGTVEDAYNFYNRIPNTISLNIDKYKISDDGTCAICYKSHTSVYDCCDNKHFNDTSEGICLNCLKEIKQNNKKCPLCRNQLIAMKNPIISVELTNQ